MYFLKNDIEYLDCLLIHVPKFNHYYPPFNDVFFINLIPMGIFSIADLLKRNGFKVKIISLGVQRLLDKQWSLMDYVKTKIPKVIGITLHWNHQSYDAIEVARALKEEFSDALIVIGGYTASFFSQEIMDKFTFIDALIKGEGEIPMLELVKSVKNGVFTFEHVKNLVWRKNGKIIKNPSIYVASSTVLESLNFSNLLLMENYQVYPKLFFYQFPKHPSLNELLRKCSIVNSFYPCIGRGCKYDCWFCGGSYLSHKIINHREDVDLVSQEKVVEEVYKAREFGFHSFSSAFDVPHDYEYFMYLFKIFRQRGDRLKWRWNLCGLPDKDLIEDFAKTFSEDSELEINVDTGSEELRKKIRGPFYTNDEFINFLDHLRRRNVKARLYFTIGNPFETKKDLEETQKFQKYIRKCSNTFQIVNIVREIDPASPLHLYPDKYGAHIERKSFMDFYNAHKRRKFDLGYSTHQFSEQDILKKKCKYFCYFGSGVKGRVICNISSWVTRYSWTDSLIRFLHKPLTLFLTRLLKV